MAVSGTMTQSYNFFRNAIIKIAGVTNGNTCPPFNSQGFPYGTVEVVLTSGTAPTSIQLQGSNDGVNFVNLGVVATTLPAMSPLTVSNESPALWYQFAISGGDGTTLVSATVLLTGSKA
jgi:hypothetical protein